MCASDQESLFSVVTLFSTYLMRGICSVLVGHPLDLAKVIQQTTRDKDAASKGTLDTLADIVSREGVAGIYKGVSAPMYAVAPIWATSFWGFDTGDKLVRLAVGLAPGTRLNLLQLCVAGGFSALPTTLVMVPCERIKCLLQTQQADKGKHIKRYNGFSDCAVQLYRERGLAGLYKGTALTLMRDIPGNVVYFGVYELSRRFLGTGATAALLSGALAGVSFWPVVLPMDCLKSRYQTAPENKYKNIGEVYSDLVHQEGVRGLFRGMKPAMIRSAPANAVSFLGAELTKSAFSKFH